MLCDAHGRRVGRSGMGMVGDLVCHCDRKKGQKWEQNGVRYSS